MPRPHRLTPGARSNGWGDPDRRAECRNCDWTGTFTEVRLPIRGDLYERLAPSEPMPCGDCPACGALARELPRCPWCGAYTADHTPTPDDCPSGDSTPET